MLKMCLRNPLVVCNEDCYADDHFCQTVVFLGYPEEKIKYPNMFEIELFTPTNSCTNPDRYSTYTCDLCKRYWENDDDNDWFDEKDIPEPDYYEYSYSDEELSSVHIIELNDDDEITDDMIPF